MSTKKERDSAATFQFHVASESRSSMLTLSADRMLSMRQLSDTFNRIELFTSAYNIHRDYILSSVIALIFARADSVRSFV